MMNEYKSWVFNRDWKPPRSSSCPLVATATRHSSGLCTGVASCSSASVGQLEHHDLFKNFFIYLINEAMAQWSVP